MRNRWTAFWLLIVSLKTFGLKEGDSVTSVGLQCLCLLPSYVMNCSWSAPDVSNSTYILFYQSLKYQPDKIHQSQAQQGQNWLVVARSQLNLGDAYSVWLEVHRAAGVEVSEKLNFTLEEIEKPPAPELDPVVVSSSGAMVRWNYFVHQPLVCELRYKAPKEAVWTHLSVDHVSQEGPELKGLHPFTLYEVQARCIQEGGLGFWSEWSAARTFRTPEAAPLGRVDVWRKVNFSGNSERALHLVWKDLDPEAARGRILNYTVDFWDHHKTLVSSVACLCHSTPVPAAASSARVSALNSVGKTQPTTLSLGQTALPGPREVQVRSAQSLGLNVTWAFSSSPGELRPEQYVVEWTNEISKEVLGWIRRPVGSRSALLRGDFTPEEPYLVSVYAVYAQGSNSSDPVRAYVQEGVPSIGPLEVRDQSVSPTVSLISWREIPLASQHGHLTHYTIYLNASTSGTPRTYGPIEATRRSYALEGLKPGSSYQLWMTGSTSVGEGHASPLHEFHTPGARWQVILVALLSVGFLLLLTIVVVFLRRGWFLSFYHKVLPLWCWERVPDPGHSLVIVNMDLQAKDIPHLSASTKPLEEPEILQITEPAPPQTVRPARVVFSDYERHFLPTQEELQKLT